MDFKNPDIKTPCVQKLPSTDCKLEDVYDPPFDSLGACLGFWNNFNPARQKYRNLAEPESSPRPPTDDFAALMGKGPPSPRDLWSEICLSVRFALQNKSGEHIAWWELRNKGEDRTRHMSQQEIAALYRTSGSTVSRAIRRINDDLIRDLKRKQILDPLY